MKYLKPFHIKEHYYKDVEKAIYNHIYLTVFNPIFEVIRSNLPIMNGYDVLVSAILSGKVQYRNGRFYGNWNAKLSRAFRDIGGKFSNRDYSFYVANVPIEIQLAISSSSNMYQDIINGIGAIDFHLDPLPYTLYDVEKKKISKGLIATLIGIVLLSGRKKEEYDEDEEITKILEYMEMDTRDYIDELNDAILRYCDNVIGKILSYVNESDGDLIKFYNFLKKLSEMAKRKSEFLAYNETNLMIENYKKDIYKTYGINRYKWITMGDDKVRPRHKELNGQIIDYNNPPIVDFKTGRTAHAHEDYNCRCKQMPIIDKNLI